MNIYNDGISLLKDGIILPHYRVLSLFFNDILKESNNKILDINCHNGNLYEFFKICYSTYNVEYVGIDEDAKNIEDALAKNFPVIFKNGNHSKFKFRTDSFDIVIAQQQFLTHKNIVEDMDSLCRISKKWVVLFNFLILQECDSYKKVEINGKEEYIMGLNYIMSAIELMDPISVECSFIIKSENPLAPTPAIFVVHIK